ncbi:MAG: BPL-N domain-containing protein [Methanobacterium sp.]|jgi:glutamine amidotransferase-like uncharacterized protein
MLIVLTLTLPLNANLAFATTGNQTNTTNTVQSTPTLTNATVNNSTTQKNTSTTSTAKLTNTTVSTVKKTNTATSTTTAPITNVNNTTTITKNIAAGSPATTTTVTETIKVLIYSGIYSASDCVTGLETALQYDDTHNVIPNVNFSYATSTVINAATLAGYNVLIMPGGDGGSLYLGSSSISGTAIKNFVANGGGYLGICAGAYAGSNYVSGDYYGWGVAPDVDAKPVSYEGLLSMKFTSAAQQILGSNGTINIAHYNGPALYVTGGKAIVLATYADDHTGYEGYADIVGDFYGNGRSVLMGSHPELTPQDPGLIAEMVDWAADVPTPETLSQIGNAAKSVDNFIDTDHKLPNYVTINNQQITMPSFLYMLIAGTLGVNSGSSYSISVKNVSKAPDPTGNYKAGNIQKTEYISIAQQIESFITANGRAPNYANTSLGEMSFGSLVHMFSSIFSYYLNHGTLPSQVSMSP